MTIDYGLRIQHSGPQYEVNDNHSGFMPAQWQASKAPRIYRQVCTTPNYVNTQTCAANNQRTIDPANPGVFSPAAYNGNIVSGSGSIINGISTDGIPGQKEGTYVQFPGVSWAPRVGFAWDVSGDGKTALRASTGIFYNFAGSSSARGFTYAYAGGCPVSAPGTIRWGTFRQDIANAASGGTTRSNRRPMAWSAVSPSRMDTRANANVAFQRDLGFNTRRRSSVGGQLGL
jgi:hypothetical protein